MVDAMGYRALVGDPEDDYESLVTVISMFYDAYLDFDVKPGVDEVSELSSWTQYLMTFLSHYEDAYGQTATRLDLYNAWQRVKED